MKNGFYELEKLSRMLRRVALVGNNVSEEHITSIIRVIRIGEIGTTLAVASNRRKLRRNTGGDTSQKREFSIVTAVKTSNLTLH
jgi:hypothetical protein